MEYDIQSIKPKKTENVIKIEIHDEDDKDTGEFLTFDLEDVSTALNWQECVEAHKRNVAYIKNQQVIISKKQDHKGKKPLSSNEEEFAKSVREFYEREIKALDMFIGEGKTETILKVMGRKPYLSMFQDIMEMIEPIFPVIEKAYKDFKVEIEKKYKVEDDILE